MFFNVAEDILPLTDFKKKTKEVLGHIEDTGRPVVLTINGKPEYALVEIGQYARERQDYELLKQLVAAERDINAGKGIPAKQALSRIKNALHL
jgi:prevent-host-death family protein